MKLLDTKHFYVEVQPREMRFYNSYYPFSGGSILAPIYYNLSANYQYQLALNYRMQEKPIITHDFVVDTTSDTFVCNLEYRVPIESQGSPLIAASLLMDSGELLHIDQDDLSYNSQSNHLEVDLVNYKDSQNVKVTLYVSIFNELHNNCIEIP